MQKLSVNAHPKPSLGYYAASYQYEVIVVGFPIGALRADSAHKFAGGAGINKVTGPRAGWLFLKSQSGPREATSILVPLVPWLPGFLFDTLFWASVSFFVGSILSRFRRYKRISKGLCPRCKYPIGPIPTCAECGEPIPGGLARAAPASTPIANESRP